jgi:hypothetical protein
MNSNRESTAADIKKYIKKHCDSTWLVEPSIESKYKLIIVVPAFDEFDNLKRMLKSLGNNNSKYNSETLIIIVINNLKSSNKTVIRGNKKTIDFLKQIVCYQNKREDKTIDFITYSGLGLAFVDASTLNKEMPEKTGGVGLARKIGMDLALNYFNYNKPGKNILGCLDADCTVSGNYITEIINAFNSQNLSAAYVSFNHPLPEEVENRKAIICYEIFLRYYVLGLKLAKSPYAFFSIGSTMFCDVESYVRIQGMNKRKAAEDFYFMEKLAKIEKIISINSATVFPSGRSSLRVPFGTGQRVSRFLSKTQNEYLLYSPRSFEILKKWLDIFNARDILSSQEYLNEAKNLSSYLFNFLVRNSFEESWNKILINSKSESQINKQKKLWFDAFKTLKLIHYLRDVVYPNENMFDALDDMLTCINVTRAVNRKRGIIPDVNDQIIYLEQLRKITQSG